MSLTGMSGCGRIRLFEDFTGEELPVAVAVAAEAAAGYGIGPYKLAGDTAETDTGFVTVSKANGFIRLSGNNEDGKGASIGTNVCFSPVLNGPLVLEARLELAALTARNVFVGFATANAADVAEPATALTVTITKVVPCVGFLLDSQLTSATYWHMPYILATDTTQTSTGVIASQAAVAAECDVLRIEVDPNGTARWFINGKLEQTKASAATTTTLLAGFVGVFGTTTTAADLDLDYLLIEANRDWTR